MTTEQQDVLADFYQGNDKNLLVTILKPDDTPKDLTGGELTYVWMTDKYVEVLRKSSLVGTEIELVAPANGVCTVHLDGKDTLSLYGTYYHHLNLVDASGVEETVLTGRINVFRTKAIRQRASLIHAYLAGG